MWMGGAFFLLKVEVSTYLRGVQGSLWGKGKFGEFLCISGWMWGWGEERVDRRGGDGDVWGGERTGKSR